MEPSPLVPAHPAPGENWFEDDPMLHELLRQHLGPERLAKALRDLTALGAVAPAVIDPLARAADRNRPSLSLRRPGGEPFDEVTFDPSYIELRDLARQHRVFTAAWHPFGGEARASRVLGFALGYLYAQAESGYYCPACMTDGAAFVLARHAPPELRDRYVQRLVSLAPEGAYEGAMYLTERGGGSDVGGGTRTTARQASGGGWRLTGEKWFASNCVADVALALARLPSGSGAAPPEAGGTASLGLFLVPRRLPDGSPNAGLRLVKLKDKLGVTSMPTGEVHFEDAVAFLVAGPGAGFKAMAEMVNLSRLYNAVASVAIARRALREGLRAGLARTAFGRKLHEHPLFARGLLELTVETEGALAFVMDTAAVFDRYASGDEGTRPLLRALTPCAKAMTARLAVSAASRGCEMLGGVGYIEDYVTPRLLRDAQVLPIWEGTTNVQALEFFRAIGREGALEPLVAHIRLQLAAASRGHDRESWDQVGDALEDLLELARTLAKASEPEQEVASLRLLERAYHTLTAALLLRLSSEPAAAPRVARIAALYVDLHLPPDAETRGRALERAVIAGADELVYPTRSPLI